ncbi:Thrombospondin type-1 (TSP1) repeat [Trinorchestia longiramus]|nr:Thrombospondin type-1 (TSP1) repeat [Trinorchestia longiramus]
MACELSTEPRSVRECEGPCDAEIQPPTPLDLLNMNVPPQLDEKRGNALGGGDVEPEESSVSGKTDDLDNQEEKDVPQTEWEPQREEVTEIGVDKDEGKGPEKTRVGDNKTEENNTKTNNNSSDEIESGVGDVVVGDDNKVVINQNHSSDINVIASHQQEQSGGGDEPAVIRDNSSTQVPGSDHYSSEETPGENIDVQTDHADSLATSVEKLEKLSKKLQEKTHANSAKTINESADESSPINIGQSSTASPVVDEPIMRNLQPGIEPLPTEKIDTGIVLEYEFLVPSVNDRNHNTLEDGDLAETSQSDDKTDFKKESAIADANMNNTANIEAKDNSPKSNNKSMETEPSQVHTKDESKEPVFDDGSNSVINVTSSIENIENRMNDLLLPDDQSLHHPSYSQETNAIDTDFTSQEYEYDPLDEVYDNQYDEYEYEYGDHHTSTDESKIEDERPVGIVEDKMNIDDFEIVEVVRVPMKKKNKNKHHKSDKSNKKKKNKKRKHKQKFVVHEGGEAIDVLNEILGGKNTQQRPSFPQQELEQQGGLQSTNFEPPAPVYSWNVGRWSNCSTNCNSGVQVRSVQCQETATGATVNVLHCAQYTAPLHTRHCNETETPDMSDRDTCHVRQRHLTCQTETPVMSDRDTCHVRQRLLSCQTETPVMSDRDTCHVRQRHLSCQTETPVMSDRDTCHVRQRHLTSQQIPHNNERPARHRLKASNKFCSKIIRKSRRDDSENMQRKTLHRLGLRLEKETLHRLGVHLKKKTLHTLGLHLEKKLCTGLVCT